MRRLLLTTLLVASCGPTAVVATPTPLASPSSTPSAAIAIGSTVFDAVRAKEHIAYLADGARGGRYSGSPGYLESAQYVADQFKAIGLEPLGDGGTYFQRFQMPLVDLSATPILSLTGADAKSWKHLRSRGRR